MASLGSMMFASDFFYLDVVSAFRSFVRDGLLLLLAYGIAHFGLSSAASDLANNNSALSLILFHKGFCMIAFSIAYRETFLSALDSVRPDAPSVTKTFVRTDFRPSVDRRIYGEQDSNIEAVSCVLWL